MEPSPDKLITFRRAIYYGKAQTIFSKRQSISTKEALTETSHNFRP